MARATTASIAPGSSGLASVAVGGADIRWANIMAASWSLLNGTSPVRTSYSTHPREYTSVRPSRALPSNCSGAA